MKKHLLLYIMIVVSLCSFKKKGKCYEHALRIEDVANSIVNYYRSYFASIPIDTSSKVSNKGFNIRKNNNQFVVIRGEELYELIYKRRGLDFQSFSDVYLQILLKKEILHLSKEEYNNVATYTISSNDAKKYLMLNTCKLINEELVGKKIGFFLEENYKLSYLNKCILHNLFYHGFYMRIDDETGGIYFNGMK